MLSISGTTLPMPLPLIANLSKPFITTVSSRKSTVIPLSAEPSFSGSMLDSTHRAAAKIPIDMAIAFMLPTFRLFCHAVKESPTVPRTSFIVSTRLLPSPARSLNPLIQLLSLSKMAVIIPPLTRSKSDFMSPFRKAFPSAFPIFEATLTIARPTFLIPVHNVFKILRNDSKPGASNLPLR